MGLHNSILSEIEPPTISIEDLEADPHGVFRRFRPLYPFIRRPDGVLLLLRATDIRHLVSDPRVRQPETEFLRLRGVFDGPLLTLFQEGMLTSNGAAHRSRRAPFAQTFAFRVIANLRPQIRAIADAIIDGWAEGTEVDVLADFASPLPARIIASVLGLPTADVPLFTRLAYSVARILSFAFGPDDLPAMQDDARQLLEYAEHLIARRRAQPVDDFLTAYLAAVDESGQLSASEAVVQIAVLILAGSDTTRAALAGMVSLLLQHDQFADLYADLSLIPSAVSESLRFEPSVGSVGRITLESINLNGHAIPADQLLTLSTMSALRDETVFRNPDVFDIRRSDQQRWHMVFGGGAHRCLGEALARAELEESLAALVSRAPGLRLTDKPLLMRGHMGIRRIGPVRVAWP